MGCVQWLQNCKAILRYFQTFRWKRNPPVEMVIEVEMIKDHHVTLCQAPSDYL